MGRRKTIPENVVARLLETSRRRCCLCVALRDDVSEKKGQIAHLDRDPSNNDPDNLVFLCLEHHDEYDSRPSQSKGFTPEEVKRYRAALPEAMAVGPSFVPPNVRVRASAALAGLRQGSAEALLAIRVENHSLGLVFVRNISLELADKKALFFRLGLSYQGAERPRELRAGESCDFHISLPQLFSDGRTPEQFLGVITVDDIGRTFRFEGEEFNKIMEALYAEHVRISEEHMRGGQPSSVLWPNIEWNALVLAIERDQFRDEPKSHRFGGWSKAFALYYLPLAFPDQVPDTVSSDDSISVTHWVVRGLCSLRRILSQAPDQNKTLARIETLLSLARTYLVKHFDGRGAGVIRRTAEGETLELSVRHSATFVKAMLQLGYAPIEDIRNSIEFSLLHFDLNDHRLSSYAEIYHLIVGGHDIVYRI